MTGSKLCTTSTLKLYAILYAITICDLYAITICDHIGMQGQLRLTPVHRRRAQEGRCAHLRLNGAGLC